MKNPSTHTFRSESRQLGFTLVEMIVVILITSIVATMVALFIRVPIASYLDSVERGKLSDAADIALSRMTRELRLALPNSVRVSPDGRYVEFLITKVGGRYLAEEDELGLTGVLNFTAATPSPNPLVFNIVGVPPTGKQAIVNGDFIVVYNLGPGFSPADAYNCAGTCNRATVNSVSASAVTMTSNPFVAQSPPMPSPTARFQVVTGAVTYYCDGTVSGVAKTGNLMRYAGYAIQASQPVDITAAPLATANNSRLADQVTSCTFNYSSLANVQRGLISLSISLGTTTSTGNVTLVKQVHVDNTP